MTRTCRLRIDDIKTDGPVTTLRLGPEPAPLPDIVRDLLEQHLAERRNTFTAANANSPWLFPGASPGQPLHQHYLMTLVRDAGVDLRGARNSALRQLECVNLTWPHRGGPMWPHKRAWRLSEH